MKTRAGLIMLACLICSQVPAAEPARTIKAMDFQTVCHRETSTVGADTAESQLCITQRDYGGDVYLFKFNDRTVIHASDDQATQGISRSYKGIKVSLTCAPRNSVSPAPPLQRLDALPSAIDTERLCEIRANDALLYAVKVKFE